MLLVISQKGRRQFHLQLRGRATSQGNDGQKSGGSTQDGGSPTANYASFMLGDDRVAADMAALVHHILTLANAIFQSKRAVPSASSFTLEAPCSDMLSSKEMKAVFGNQESKLDK